MLTGVVLGLSQAMRTSRGPPQAWRRGVKGRERRITAAQTRMRNSLTLSLHSQNCRQHEDSHHSLLSTTQPDMKLHSELT